MGKKHDSQYANFGWLPAFSCNIVLYFKTVILTSFTKEVLSVLRCKCNEKKQEDTFLWKNILILPQF